MVKVSEDSNTGKLIPVKRQPNNLKSSCRMMIEKVMIQLGVHFNRKGVGGGHKAKSQLGKQRMRKAKARKPPKAKAKKPAELAMQRMRKRGTMNAEDSK